jgi:type III restriction enzyme
MTKVLQLQFDPNQKHQIDAVESVADLFEGMQRISADAWFGGEINPNLPPFESFSETWLYENLRGIQKKNELVTDLIGNLDVDDGMVLEGVGNESWRYPSFTVEMETGTGKTYVALRTIHELRKRYGFSKFVIVVPSIAIYEGWIKNIEITNSHFRSLYGNENVEVVKYDGSKLSQLRSFATSTFIQILIITLDSFNKMSNVIFKPSEKLPGERLPYQFIQETRPILILDEPQNMESEKSREALRTLHPLFALRYSATHRTSPNLVYRLSPFDAYRLNLVKRIQVHGVTERENFNQPFLALDEVTLGKSIKASVRTYLNVNGSLKEGKITLSHGDNLFSKTQNDSHQDGYIVSEISARPGNHFVEFRNGIRLTLNNAIGPSKADIFRIQIRSTLEQHMKTQQKLVEKGIKVLSLFFIDHVANYVNEGIIKKLFDEEFDRMKGQYSFYEKMSPSEVQGSYFAVYRGKTIDTPIEDEARKTKEQLEAEKAAFVLIMRDKEKLLSFDEKTCFIFAHSALKEGWDNPNVFQICTLNQTSSVMKKRQEIGRGLRLAVNQLGERVFDEDINILTVVANESYENYASTLQTEYQKDGEVKLPPAPTNLGKAKAKRNDEIFLNKKEFRDFWAKLQKFARYEISVDTPALIDDCVALINKHPTPQAVLVVEKGSFVMVEYKITLESTGPESCRLKIVQKDTQGNESSHVQAFILHNDLGRELHDERLRGYKIVEIHNAGEESVVVFGNKYELTKTKPIIFQSEKGQQLNEKQTLAPKATYPVFNLIDRAAKETGLTRKTLNQIFSRLQIDKKESIFVNPEGFASIFISDINNALAEHVARRIKFVVEPAPTYWGFDIDDTFPPEKEFPQKELVDGSKKSLYDKVQVDSEVEVRFVQNRLNQDEDMLFYFKFPPTFKIKLPRVIGNYNPDWGIARFSPEKKITIELIRETKGTLDLAGLQFPSERRKIYCAREFFRALGLDYRHVDDRVVDWWKPGEDIFRQAEMN